MCATKNQPNQVKHQVPTHWTQWVDTTADDWLSPVFFFYFLSLVMRAVDNWYTVQISDAFPKFVVFCIQWHTHTHTVSSDSFFSLDCWTTESMTTPNLYNKFIEKKMCNQMQTKQTRIFK